jgi:ABC-type phosphate transport system substrate-binding protein
MKKKVLHIVAFLTMYFAACVISYSQDFKVIVNIDSQIESITIGNISDYFLKKKLYWNNDMKIVPVDQIVNSKVRESFTKIIHEKSVAQIRAFWQQSVFSGKAVPPVEKASDQEVIDFVMQHKGAIGYVSSDANTSDVREIKIVKE